MNVVDRVGSIITTGVYSVATPFHPFGGAVDIIVVQQQDGSFRCTPWYVRFGKFQGVLRGSENVVRIQVNGVEASFHMYIDNSGEAYFVKEADSHKESEENGGLKVSDNLESSWEDSREFRRKGVHNRHETNKSLDSELEMRGVLDRTESGYYEFHGVEHMLESQSNSSPEVVLVSVDGHMLTAPISSSDNAENVELSIPQFHLGPGEGTDFCEGIADFSTGEAKWGTDCLGEGGGGNLYKLQESFVLENKDTKFHRNYSLESTSSDIKNDDVFKSCLELSELALQVGGGDEPSLKGVLSSFEMQKSFGGSEEKTPLSPSTINENEDGSPEKLQNGNSHSMHKFLMHAGLEISLCGNLLSPGMGLSAAAQVFEENRISEEEFRSNAKSIIKNKYLVIRIQGKYLSWERASPIVLGMAAYDLELPIESSEVIPVEQDETPKTREDDSGRRWWLWPIPFRRVKVLEHTSSISTTEDASVDSECNQAVEPSAIPRSGNESPHKKLVRTNVPTSVQIKSLKLKEGQNMVTFIFSTRVLGVQKVEAHIYLWKWNARIVISDVDGTITKSDVLGQFMPLVGKDWTHSGIARLFSAIKENGYQLLFLSARAIVQAYLTRSFLFNIKQDGQTLPNGPVVISPDGLFPSLYREVIRRAPHEFKIACLQDIKALFPPDYNPFYAGFGNRDTDELSYRRIGIPKGKIFIINPKGEVAINHRLDVKSYTSLHTLVNDMFPPTSMLEQEDFNDWNHWKLPLLDIGSS